MDFHGLTRKELQALCKRNKIPANTTNISMADSLSSLQHVEGLEELSNQTIFDPPKFPEDTVIIASPDSRPPPRSACRTSTRLRKPAVTEEPESSQPTTRTRRATRPAVVVAVDGERNDVPPITPAPPSTRRKAAAASVTKRTDARDGAIGSVRSTRRSVRLLELNLEKLSLGGEDVMVKPVEIDDEFSKEAAVDDDSERRDEKEVSLEKIEEIQMSENSHEEEDSKSSLIEGVESVPIVELSNDVENDDSVVAEVSDKVDETLSLLVYPSRDDVPTENLKVESENVVAALTGEEESPKLETPTEVSLVEDSIAIGNSDFGPSVTEFVADDDSSKEEHANKTSADDESEESDFESSLVDVEVVEGQVIIPANESQGKLDFVSELITEDADTSLIDVSIVQAEEIKESIDVKAGPKTPLPMSSPFAADHLSGQFPRPSLHKSPSKSHPVTQMITNVLDENEETIEVKNEESENDDKTCAAKSYETLSLIELRKLLKTKLQIKNDKVENTRIALQTLSENLPKES